MIGSSGGLADGDRRSVRACRVLMARLAGLLASKPWPWVKEGPEPVMLGVGTVVRSGLGCAPGERDRTRGLRQLGT